MSDELPNVAAKLDELARMIEEHNDGLSGRIPIVRLKPYVEILAQAQAEVAKAILRDTPPPYKPPQTIHRRRFIEFEAHERPDREAKD
jgi:hypothetical protein